MGKTTDYQDFEIELSRCCCGEPEIRVLESTTNRPRVRFELGDEQRSAIEAKVATFERLLFNPKVDGRERKELSEEIGRDLYHLLLPEPIRRTFTRSLDVLHQTNDGLRIRLSFGTPYDHELGGLPWELLYDPSGRFLAADARTPVARFLDLDDPIAPLRVGQQLRVLGVIACPDDRLSDRFTYSRIDPAPHRAVIAGAIQPTRYLQVDFLHDRGPVTASALREYLMDAEAAGKPFHAIHFLGHGGFDAAGEGALFFERETGEEHLVTGRELAELLPRSVRLVVLASCNTGKIPTMRSGSKHAFTGVASGLLHDSIPAVVAMQFSVSEPAAAAFAQGFYRMIDRDQPIDKAVTEGRLRIKTAGEKDALEWATPVLFLRARDGRVLDLRTDVVPPKTVAIFSVTDHGKERMDHVDDKADLCKFFDGRAIKNPDDWNGAIMDDLRHKLRRRLPAGSPCHLEIAAPLSVTFAAGFLLPAKKREAITLRQRDKVWHFDGDPPAYAPLWLAEEATAQQATSKAPDFPLVEGARDIAVVADGSRSILAAVADYLGRSDLAPPTIGHLLYAGFERADQYLIKDGAHARVLAEQLVARIDDLARQNTFPTIHFFSPGPQGLVFAIGRVCHVLPRIQLYEFDMEKKRHGSYEPSIVLVPAEMGGDA